MVTTVQSASTERTNETATRRNQEANNDTFPADIISNDAEAVPPYS